jgi:hypothetical protein
MGMTHPTFQYSADMEQQISYRTTKQSMGEVLTYRSYEHALIFMQD